jgi:hypothetical protein
MTAMGTDGKGLRNHHIGRNAMRNGFWITAIATVLVVGLTPFQTRADDRGPPTPPPTSYLPPAKPRGTPSCADWMKYSGSQPNSTEKSIELSQQAWLIGYLAGLAAATETDIPPRITNAALYAWIDHYCGANPQAMVSDGAGNLVFGLRQNGSL